MEFLSNLSTLEIIVIIVVTLLFGGLLWRVAKKLFALALIAVLIIFGIYVTKPEILYEWFGKDNVHKVEHVVKEKSDEAKKETNKFADELADDLDSN